MCVCGGGEGGHEDTRTRGHERRPWCTVDLGVVVVPLSFKWLSMSERVDGTASVEKGGKLLAAAWGYNGVDAVCACACARVRARVCARVCVWCVIQK